jgi:fructokinase
MSEKNNATTRIIPTPAVGPVVMIRQAINAASSAGVDLTSVRPMPQLPPPADLDVLAVGETVVDLIGTEPEVGLRDVAGFTRHQGGSPANLTRWLAAMGRTAAIVSKVGSGPFGRFLEHELRRAGVFTEYLLQDPARHTSLVFASRTRGTPEFEPARDADMALEVADLPQAALTSARIVHSTAYALSRMPCREAVTRALETARAAGRVTSLDPNYAPKLFDDPVAGRRIVTNALAGVDLTKPSLDDCRRIFGRDDEPENQVQRFHDLGPRVVVLTMGAEGVLVSEGDSLHHVPARPVDPVDVTGAGDAFWAGFLTSLLGGYDLLHSARFAVAVAAHKLETVGFPDGPVDVAAFHAVANGVDQPE